MAKDKTDKTEATETPEAATETVTDNEAVENGEATSKEVVEELTATEELAQLEIDFKERKAALKLTAKTEGRTAAIDLVEAAGKDVVSDLIYAINRRGYNANNFTIRYNSKAEGDGINNVVGVTKMTVKAFEEFPKANPPQTLREKADELAEEAKVVYAEVDIAVAAADAADKAAADEAKVKVAQEDAASKDSSK